MRRDHVADVPDLLVERPSTLDADVLGHRDLHVVDVPAVPRGLEHPVREPEGQDVLHGLLAQVVVDPIDLRLVEHRVDVRVQLLRAHEVAPERLLEHDLRAGVQSGLSDPAHDLRVGGRGGGRVEEPPAPRAEPRVDLLEVLDEVIHGPLVVELTRQVRQVPGEVVPDLALGSVRRELHDVVVGVLAELLVRPYGPRVAGDREPLRQQPAQEQVVERRQQLASREITRSPEDHDRLRVEILRDQPAPPRARL